MTAPHRTAVNLFALATVVLVQACEPAPEPFRFGKDPCAFCKMTILDPRFAAQAVTGTGKVYKFDDLLCAAEYCRVAGIDSSTLFGLFVTSFQPEHGLMRVEQSLLVKADAIRSPMGGDVAAFPLADSAVVRTLIPDARMVSWPAALSAN